MTMFRSEPFAVALDFASLTSMRFVRLCFHGLTNCFSATPLDSHLYKLRGVGEQEKRRPSLYNGH